jgi:hypothetical protein
MTKRKPQTTKRKRGLPIQVYVSPEERADLRATARKRGVTVSTLVRNWIRRAAAAEWRVAAAAAAAARDDDPRQLSILKHATGKSQFVVVGDACDACCNSPLLHLGIHDASCPRAD